MEERLQKILSERGVCSRRTAEEYLKQGRIAVNGRTAALGDKADPDVDQITLDGKSLAVVPDRRTYLMLYKPRGYITTLSDEKGRKTVALLVKECGSRVWPVGRLDMDSEGLLLMTNDGDFTNFMTHPKHEIQKEYEVWVDGELTAERLEKLSKPMILDGQRLRPAKVRKIGAGVISVVIHEGKNRQVRRMCALVGLEVRRLKRVREGSLLIGELRPGQWRFLNEDEVKRLTAGEA